MHLRQTNACNTISRSIESNRTRRAALKLSDHHHVWVFTGGSATSLMLAAIATALVPLLPKPCSCHGLFDRSTTPHAPPLHGDQRLRSIDSVLKHPAQCLPR
jgi:hypothetical protein